MHDQQVSRTLSVPSSEEVTKAKSLQEKASELTPSLCAGITCVRQHGARLSPREYDHVHNCLLGCISTGQLVPVPAVRVLVHTPHV